MAPIPTKLPEEALSLISAIERRLAHISEVEVPKLRACTGPLSVQQTLAEDVREDTVALTRQIESLNMMVDDQQGEKNRRDLRDIASGFQKKLDVLRRDTRSALLTSKKAIDSRSKSNRDELFSSSAMSEKQTSSEKTTEDLLMKANSDVTDALRRTITLMQNELERSVLTTQMLDESTKTLRSASTQHDVLSNVMYTSKQLVTALEKSDWLDRILILSGLVFFFLVVLLILKQRIVDRGIRIAFWWTRFIPSFSDDAQLLRDAEKGMIHTAAAVTTSLSSTATTVASTLIPVAASIASSVSASIASVVIPFDDVTLTESTSSEATPLPAVEISTSTDDSTTVEEELPHPHTGVKPVVPVPPRDPPAPEPPVHVEL